MIVRKLAGARGCLIAFLAGDSFLLPGLLAAVWKQRRQGPPRPWRGNYDPRVISTVCRGTPSRRSTRWVAPSSGHPFNCGPPPEFKPHTPSSFDTGLSFFFLNIHLLDKFYSLNYCNTLSWHEQFYLKIYYPRREKEDGVG